MKKEEIRTTGQNGNTRKPLTFEDLKNAAELLDKYNRRPPTHIPTTRSGMIKDLLVAMRSIEAFPDFNVTELHLLPKNSYYMIPEQRIIYVECIYPIIFEVEKDFKKAVDQSIDYALNKIRDRINYRVETNSYDIQQMIHRRYFH